MKKKNISKKALAIFLSFVMIATSLPLAMVSAASTYAYDPAPYFGENNMGGSAVNVNFIATMNDDGSMDIAFPHAKAQNTYDGSAQKTIKSYIVTLTEMNENGARVSLLTKLYSADAITSADALGFDCHINIDSATIKSVLPNGYKADARYDVGIEAIDSDGWISEAIHTLANDTPYYEISDDFSPQELWISRNILDFEGKESARFWDGKQSDNGASGSHWDVSNQNNATAIDYLYTGQNSSGEPLIDANGMFNEMGYKKSHAYRFWIRDASSTTPYEWDATWSRQHYDFSLQGTNGNYNDAEVWFYVDMSDVEVSKIAFRLTANEKWYLDYIDNDRYAKDDSDFSRYGTVFSTATAGGANVGTTDKGLYIQTEDGLWEKTSMTNGYFTELSGYKGFVRIPIEYFVLQTDQYIVIDNDLTTENIGSDSAHQTYNNNHKFAAGETLVRADGSTVTADANGFKVNPAGTPITESLIVWYRETIYSSGGFIGVNQTDHAIRVGNMLHPGTTVSVNGTTNTITNGVYAIHDIASAGFEMAEWTSSKKSFYIDQVMICQEVDAETQKKIEGTYNNDTSSADYGKISISSNPPVYFTSEGADGFDANDGGSVVKSFYDRTVEVPKAIAGYIMEYLGEIPSLDDINPVEQIDAIIEKYLKCFPGCTTVEQAINFLEAKYPEAYKKYSLAKDFINTYTQGSNQTAVALFEQRVEVLYDTEFIDVESEKIQDELLQLMAIYQSFNMAQFELLGKDMEERFQELYKIVMGEEVEVGYSIGAFPFIPFNDFETKISGNETGYTLGQKSLKYYDDYPTYQDERHKDVNNTKNFVTYATNSTVDMSNGSDAADVAIGFAVEGYAPSSSTRLVSTNFSKIDAEITDEGFANSMGATVYLQGDLNNTNVSNGYNLVTLATTYKGQNVTEWAALDGLNLSALSVNKPSRFGKDSEDVERYGGALPNSFVMYVDFSNVSNLAMNIQFILQDSSGNDVVCFLCAGADGEDPNIYLLDEKGEWEEQALSQTPLDVSEAGNEAQTGICTIYPSDLNSLQGYKGFIRIPLVNFRTTYRSGGVAGIGSTKYNDFLDNLIDDHTIKQVKVSFWDYSGENNDTKVNIDAIGFTYDPSCTTRAISSNSADVINKLNNDNGLVESENEEEDTGIKNMDEYFKVKTNDSTNFQQAVYNLDPYAGKDAFKQAYNAAIQAHSKLSIYQRERQDVIETFDYLRAKYEPLYNNYDVTIAQDEWKPKYENAAELIADLDALTVTDVDVTAAENRIQYPYNYATGQIDYSALGIADLNEANEIIKMYEVGYGRLSKAQQQAVADAGKMDALTRAYNSARRIVELEKDMAEAASYRANVTSLYQLASGYDDANISEDFTEIFGDNFKVISAENENLDATFQQFMDMSIFAKLMVTNTTAPSLAYAANMYAASRGVYRNSTQRTMSDGTKVDGGITIYEQNMVDYYNTIKAKYDNNHSENIGAEMLADVRYCIGQYETLIQRYYNVDELSSAYTYLLSLFPEIVTEKGTDELMLSQDALETDGSETSASTDYTINYAVLLDREEPYTDGFYIRISTESEKGVMTDSAGNELAYNLRLNMPNVADAEFSADQLNGYTDDAWKSSYPIKNDTATTSSPYVGTFTASVTAAQANAANLSGTARDTVIVELCSTDGTVVDTFNIYVSYSIGDAYTVTIPADFPVDWDDSGKQDVSYSVITEMNATSSIKVKVSSDGTGKMASVIDPSLTLDYVTEGFDTETEFSGMVSGGAPDQTPYVTVSGWDAVPVGEYRTTLTYTVVYEADDGTT